MADLTFGSVFAGIGGIDLGFERAGWTCKWQIENDDYCNRVLAKHWPDVKRYGDVQQVDGAELEPVTLIAGGFPCQDISNAGKRAGIEGSRSGLWAEMFRLVCEVRPRLVLVENVAALLVRGMGRVLGDLAEGGYDAEWDCIPAAAVGAPHIRNRVFILAHATVRRSNNEPAKTMSGITDRHPLTRLGFGGGRIRRSAHSEQTVADAEGVDQDQEVLRQGRRLSLESGGGSRSRGIWATEPDVGGSPDGFPMWLYRHCGRGMSYAESMRAVEGLRRLWTPDAAQALWQALGGLGRMEAAEVLFAFLCEYPPASESARIVMACAEALEDELRGVRLRLSVGSPPSRQDASEQSAEQHPDIMCELPCEASSWNTWEGGVPRVADKVPARVDRLRGLGNAVVPQVAEWIAWRIREAIGGDVVAGGKG